MKISNILLLATALLTGAAVLAQQPAISDPLAPPPRPLVLRVPEAAQPVRLTRVNVDVMVVGRLARTTVEMTFHNPNARLLEGELQFPLLLSLIHI